MNAANPDPRKLIMQTATLLFGNIKDPIPSIQHMDFS